MKNILKIIGFSFALIALAASCDNQLPVVNGKASGNVVIRLAGSDGRTVMPSAPVFSRYELALQNGETKLTPDAGKINGAGVTVNLTAGVWTITLNAYQEINDKEILAAKGAYELTIVPSQSSYNVVMELNPAAIEDAVDNGLFTFNITLPLDADSAILILDGVEYDLIIDGSSGSVELAAGYYDFSVILKKNTQSAGVFESAHIYSGLESAAVLDLSNIRFADKVYLTGALGGIRIGTITITDKAGAEIKTVALNDNSAKRSNSWLTDISSKYIGETVSVSLEFNGETVTKDVTLTAKGSAGINLNLVPATVKYANLASWYSEISVNQYAELILDFGFDVTVNFSPTADIYYSIGAIAWTKFNNYTTGESGFGDIPNTVTAKKFKMVGVAGIGDFERFGLYYAADHKPLINAVASAEANYNSVETSTNGKNVTAPAQWVTAGIKSAYLTVINNEKAKVNNPVLSEEILSAAIANLADAADAFNAAKALGRYVNKSALQKAINDANSKMAGVIKANDGSQLMITDKWAAVAMFDNLNVALAAANEINNDEEADIQAEIDAAANALNSAIAAFIIKNGDLIETGFGFNVTFNQPRDETITLSAAQTISWLKNEYLDINVTEQFDAYQWYVDGKIIDGNGNSIRIFAQDYSVAKHTLTLKVTKNGVPYTKTLNFTVVFN